MRTVFRIFKNDIRSIVKYFFVLVIVLALGVLPSLYAWINIYASWDPYGNTGNLEIALASRDTGIKLQDGTYVNAADEVIREIKDDKDIRYVPLDTAEEAVDGVTSGRFYAAFVFEDGFTYDMRHFEEAIGDEDAKITYYENVKNNAVAIKIIDNFSESLQGDINSKYLKAMLTKYFGDAGDVLDEVDKDEAVDTALAQLISTRDAIHDFSASISQIKSSKGDVTKAIKNAEKKLKKASKNGSTDIDGAESEIEKVKGTVEEVGETVDSETKKLETAFADLNATLGLLQGPISEDEKEELTEKALEITDRILTILQNLRAILPENPQTTAGRLAADTIDVMLSDAEHIKTLLTADPSMPEITVDLSELRKIMDEDLTPSLALMLTDIQDALDRTRPLLESADGLLDDISPVLKSAGSTVNSLDSSLAAMQGMLGPLETKLNDMIAQVQDAEDGDKEEVLEKLLGHDAEQYGSFFTDFVRIESHQLYQPVSYGAAMSPFYTIIALWVGAVMLVTIMNVNVDRRKYPGITEAQGFFGRWLIYFLLGQIQAACVVAGDIFLLQCSPVHPWLMWLSAAVASLVFVTLIYALTLAFGDIGRAAVIVIMMIQIAGSSGSFPIEILPDIFDKIYKFFPFPYAIDAMREAMFGLYGHHFVIFLAQLMVFFVCAVLIGLLVRKPFIGVKEFMAEKMKETEVL